MSNPCWPPALLPECSPPSNRVKDKPETLILESDDWFMVDGSKGVRKFDANKIALAGSGGGGGSGTPPSDLPYDPVAWDGNLDAATKNALRDKFESLATGGGASSILVTGSDGAQYEKTTYPDSTIRYKPLYESVPGGFLPGEIPESGSTLVTGTDGADYERTVYYDGTIRYKPTYATLP